MSNLFVVAELRAVPGKRDAMEAELKKVIPTVRAEEGCIRYDLLRSVEGSSLFLQEIWTGKEALTAHLATTHMTTLFAAIGDLLAAPPAITELNAVDMA